MSVFFVVMNISPIPVGHIKTQMIDPYFIDISKAKIMSVNKIPESFFYVKHFKLSTFFFNYCIILIFPQYLKHDDHSDISKANISYCVEAAVFDVTLRDSSS